jgi:uncharacterized protein (TIRG00374 family)
LRRTDIIPENTPPPKSTSQDWRRILPGLAVSALCLVIIFYLIKPHKLVNALRMADYRLVIGGGILTLLWLAVRGAVWRTLLQEKASPGQTFLTLNEGYLLNNFLPLRLGEVGRAFLLGRKTGLSFWYVFSSILIERAVDVVFAASLLLSTLPFVVGASVAWETALGIAGLVLLGLGALYLMARHPTRAMRLFERLTTRWSFLSKLGGSVLPAFFSGLEVLTDRTRFLRAIILFAANLTVGVVQYYVILLAFFPGARLLWVVFVMAVSSLGMALPSSPGAVGVFEGAVVGALVVFNLDPAKALAYAFTLHFWNYVITGILGAYALSRDGESLTHLYERVRRVKKDDE